MECAIKNTSGRALYSILFKLPFSIYLYHGPVQLLNYQAKGFKDALDIPSHSSTTTLNHMLLLNHYCINMHA